MAEQTIREKVTQEVRDGFERARSSIVSHTSEVLGSTLGTLIDDFKGLTSSMLSILTTGISGILGGSRIERAQLAESEKQTGLLRGILNMFKLEQKKELREGGGTIFIGMPEMLITAFLVFVGAVSAALGGIVGKILLPFQVLIKSLKPIGPVAKGIFGLFGGLLRLIGRLPGIRYIVGIFDSFLGGMRGISGAISTFIKNSRFFSTIVEKFAHGFKRLAWPISIIFGIIDFFQGFFGTEGSIIAKIKAGLTEVLQGFFELPIKLLGGISDGVLSKMGMGVEGGIAQKINEGIELLINNIVDGIVGALRMVSNAIGILFESIIPAAINRIKDIINSLPKILVPKSLEEWAADKESGDNVYRGVIDKSPINALEDNKNKRIADEKARERREKTESAKKQTRTDPIVNQYIDNSAGYTKSSDSETPDQVEHFGLLYMNTQTLGASH